MTASLAKLRTKARSAVEEFSTGIESTRQRIAKLQAEREGYQNQYVMVDEAIARLDRWLDKHTSNAVDHLYTGGLVLPGKDAGPPLEVKPSDQQFGWLLLAAVKDQVRAIIVEKVEADYCRHPGIAAADRAERLDKIDRELFDLNVTEESMIRAAQQAGINIARRGDADPRVVLATDDCLPE